MQKIQRKAATILTCAAALGTLPATAADDVQRQLQQRQLQQRELRLKMQQQLDQAARPAQTPAAGFRQRQVDRDQRQRLQQSHDQEVRGAIAPATDVQGEIERRRGVQIGAEQLKRFDTERRLEVDPNATR